MTPESEYRSYLSGKRVALVGPAPSGPDGGSKIDSYDVVVRLNNMVNVPSSMREHLGSRTDVLYATLDGNPLDLVKSMVDNSVKFVSTSYPADEWFFRARMMQNVSILKSLNAFGRVDLKTVVLPSREYFHVKEATSSRPNTGFSAIIDLLSADIEELYITGLDFYRSAANGGAAYMPGYECQWTEKRGPDFLLENIERDGPDVHNPDSSFKYFKHEMYAKDDRVKVDSCLLRYLQYPVFEELSNFFPKGNDSC